MIIAVGSTNPVKINAAQIAFSQVFPEQKIVINHKKVDSGVPEQPWGEDTIRGAMNRAKKILELIKDANFGIGLEGGIEQNSFGYFTFGWAAVTDKTNKLGLGRSGNLEVPQKLIDFIKQENLEMGLALDKMVGTDNIKQKEGYVGYVTGNLITRTDLYVQATICALAKFIKPKFFQEKTLSEIT